MEAECLFDKLNGKGKIYVLEKLFFEGEFFNDMIWKGKYYYFNGDIKFEGEYLGEKGKILEGNLKLKGKGDFSTYKILKDSMLDANLIRGEVLNGKINGHTKMYNNNAVMIFEGEYLNGEKNGYAKEYNESGFL